MKLKGDIPGERMMIFIGVVLIGMLFLTTIILQTLTPNLKSSEEARFSLFRAHHCFIYRDVVER